MKVESQFSFPLSETGAKKSYRNNQLQFAQGLSPFLEDIGYLIAVFRMSMNLEEELVEVVEKRRWHPADEIESQGDQKCRPCSDGKAEN